MPGTTPIYGFPYPQPTDLVADYPSLGQDLAQDIEAVLPTIGGLVGRPPTSIANTGGTATLSGNTVTFTGVSSFSVNGAFNSTFANYRCVLTIDMTSAVNIYWRGRTSGTDNTTNNYYWGMMYSAGASATSAASTFAQLVDSTNGLSAQSFDVYSPFTSTNTVIASFGQMGGTSRYVQTTGSTHVAATSFDGLTIYPASSTMSGKLSIYAYRP